MKFHCPVAGRHASRVASVTLGTCSTCLGKSAPRSALTNRSKVKSWLISVCTSPSPSGTELSLVLGDSDMIDSNLTQTGPTLISCSATSGTRKFYSRRPMNAAPGCFRLCRKIVRLGFGRCGRIRSEAIPGQNSRKRSRNGTDACVCSTLSEESDGRQTLFSCSSCRAERHSTCTAAFCKSYCTYSVVR